MHLALGRGAPPEFGVGLECTREPPPVRWEPMSTFRQLSAKRTQPALDFTMRQVVKGQGARFIQVVWVRASSFLAKGGAF